MTLPTRNFCIIAHIDHGKTTLTDRLLQVTQTVASRDAVERQLDSNPIERQRGITIKLAPVTMNYQLASPAGGLKANSYKLNLIDTPGHVDFSYEVERSLAACEGAILLVDATQGVQAQTVAHAYKAVDLGLTILPVINKIDLPSANIPQVTTELTDMFGFKASEISQVSAKTGNQVHELIERVITEIPAPQGKSDDPLRALIFNSTYDPHLGVIAFIRIVDGRLTNKDLLWLMKAKNKLDVKEVGIFSPERRPVESLEAGAVGYIATGLKSIRDLKVGDTLTSQLAMNLPTTLTPLPGYKEPQHTVYADFYPGEDADFEQLKNAVEKLQLTDAALSSKPVHSPALGSGFRLGFLGVFHIEITKERLLSEQNVATILTNPTVEYQVTTTDGQSLIIQNSNDLPDPSQIKEIHEPVCAATILTPAAAIGQIMELMQTHRSTYKNTSYIGARAQLTYDMPLSELISGFFDELKSASAGFATLDYELTSHQPVDAVKLSIFLNHDEMKSLSRIVVRSQAEAIGRKIVSQIKELLPRHLFAIPIQAAIGGTVVARETKPASRKDVTAKLYGGDQTRKDKLLKKQKKGKKRMQAFGRVQVPDNLLTKLATI